MISLLRRKRRKIKLPIAAPDGSGWSTPDAGLRAESVGRPSSFPTPIIRWVAEGRIGLRAFDFDADADAVCSFQEETYALNFPDFRYTTSFAEAFRYDLRRAWLDPNHGIFVLDDGRENLSKNRQKIGNIAGFLWVVICHNNWSGERYGYVNNVYVPPSRRGSGLSKELVKQGEEWFRSRSIKRVRLTVTETNEAAIAVYRSCGYAVDRWEMEKTL